MAFIPMTQKEVELNNWSEVDFVLVTGDAYVDHPSFGVAVIARQLEHYGYKVAILAQPKYDTFKEFRTFGKPRLGFLITGGNVDSMVNHYSVSKKRRSKDVYTPNGVAGKRPDRATIKYSQLARQAYSDVPIILGGLEASLRRLAHYDYWDNKVRRSILLDSHADLLVYGMGEQTIIEIAEALDSGIAVDDIVYIRGTVWKTKDKSRIYEGMYLPTYDEIIESKKEYSNSFNTQYQNTDSFTAKPLIESYRNVYVVQNPPQHLLTESELDQVYNLKYERKPHPTYDKIGHIPATEEVKFSIIANRGCFGNCSFCALTFHQGRAVVARSDESIINEAHQIINDPNFKGYIHDVGGPTANFMAAACNKQKTKGSCSHKQCLHPTVCKQMDVSHNRYLNLLRKLRKLPKVKKVFVRSGIRFDYLMEDKDDSFFHELVQHHISGQLKVAPEHVSDTVLDYMGKPKHQVYEKFYKKYHQLNQKYNKNQFLVPYLISSHPGSTLTEAIEVAEYTRNLGYTPLQVQDFYPTPGTLSTSMYYTEIDPRTMKKVKVVKNPREKAMQRALLQYKTPKNYELVAEALKKANREDLIGYDKKCLIKPKVNNTSSKGGKPWSKGKTTRRKRR